jgi:hypothetical protein
MPVQQRTGMSFLKRFGNRILFRVHYCVDRSHEASISRKDVKISIVLPAEEIDSPNILNRVAKTHL